MVFWLSLMALTLLKVAGRSAAQRRWWLAVVAAAALWILGVMAPAHLRQARSIRDLATEIRAAHDAIVVGISERSAYEASLSLIARQPKGLDQVARHAPFLRERQLGMFATGRAALLGLRIGADLNVVETRACGGRLIGLHRFDDTRDIALFGSLARGGSRFGHRTILISDPSGWVVGLGSTTSFAALENVDISSEPDAEDWIAFARVTLTPGTLSVWALVDHRAVCRLSGRVPSRGES